MPGGRGEERTRRTAAQREEEAGRSVSVLAPEVGGGGEGWGHEEGSHSHHAVIGRSWVDVHGEAEVGEERKLVDLLLGEQIDVEHIGAVGGVDRARFGG